MESDLDPLMISYDDDSKLDSDLQAFKSKVKSMISNVLEDGGPESGFVILQRSIRGLSSLNQKVLEQIFFFKANKPSAKGFWGRRKTRKTRKNEAKIDLLADQYINYSGDLLGFVAELESFQKKAQDSCTLVKDEVGKYFRMKKDRQQRQFYPRDHCAEGSTCYQRVTKISKNLKACDNIDEPSTNKLLEKLKALQVKQETMLTSLRKQERKLGNKQDFIPLWRKAKNFVFMGTVASMVIAVIVTAAVGAVPIAGLIATFLPSVVGGGRWLGPIVEKHRDSVNYKVDLIKSMLEGAEDAKIELETIKYLINKVVIEIDSLLSRSGSNIDEEQIDSKMKRIDHQMGDYLKQLRELEKETDTFSKQILKAMKEVTTRRDRL